MGLLLFFIGLKALMLATGYVGTRVVSSGLLDGIINWAIDMFFVVGWYYIKHKE